jgi:hypothetical protein
MLACVCAFKVEDTVGLQFPPIAVTPRSYEEARRFDSYQKPCTSFSRPNYWPRMYEYKPRVSLDVEQISMRLPEIFKLNIHVKLKWI